MEQPAKDQGEEKMVMDREKVIKEFELYIRNFHPACTSDGVELDMLKAVQELLKEQETTRWKQISPAGIYECEKCGKHIISQDMECFKYCFNCGRPVK